MVKLSQFSSLPNPLPALQNFRPTLWLNPQRSTLSLQERQAHACKIAEAEARLQRFAPWFYENFPDTQSHGGLIESDLLPVPRLEQSLNREKGFTLPGKLYLKNDANLPVSASIKARGGIHHVLCIVEDVLAKTAALKDLKDYRTLSTPHYQRIFQNYEIVVSSTGNLALSIGISARAFGFKASVFMSRDAAAWKKQLLHELGAKVIEVDGDYGKAVAQGRNYAHAQSQAYFVDDENSPALFYAYAVAAKRLAQQLKAAHIPVDAKHPLLVFLPCGVGGGPGGISMGLELIYAEHVHSFFAEPTHAPAALLAFASGRGSQISCADIHSQKQTIQDGLAVYRISELVYQAVKSFIAGVYTVSDERSLYLLQELWEQEQIFLEPSSVTAFEGPYALCQSPAWSSFQEHFTAEATDGNFTFISWGTGGGMVPEAERKAYLRAARQLFQDN